MTKTAFIGGGGVRWSPKAMTDIALCETLADAHIALHDIDIDALGLLTRACERIAAQADRRLQVSATPMLEDLLAANAAFTAA